MKTFFRNIWCDLWGRYRLGDWVDLKTIKDRAIPVKGDLPWRIKFKWFGLYHYKDENVLVSRTRFLGIPYLTLVDLETERTIPRLSRTFLGGFYLFILPYTVWLLIRFGTPFNLNTLFLIFLIFFVIQWQIHDEQARATGAFRQYTTPKHKPNRAWNAQKLLIICWIGYLSMVWIPRLPYILAEWATAIAEKL